MPLTPRPNDHNLAYLLTKRDRMGHELPDLPASSTPRRRARERPRRARPTSRSTAATCGVAVVAAQWHTEVMDGLLAGARRALRGVRA